jgi:hypothetical protein
MSKDFAELLDEQVALRFKYVYPRNEAHNDMWQEIQDWSNERFGRSEWIAYMENYRFVKESDMLLFKLRWA